jgi:chemotaxis protein MotB
MQMKRYFLVGMTVLIMSGLMVSGCAVNFYKQSPRSKKQIKELQSRIDDLEVQRREERKRFEEAKRMLEGKLKDDKRISLEVDERGLVIILSDDILFDSGKAEIKKKAYPILDNVASVVKKKVPDKNIGVTGHTDNVPITYSKWESNWELSTARATNVLHYLESRGIPPKKLSATGYGEHHPIESNATAEGRAKNRRVEIVILPEFEKKKQGDVLSGTRKESIK